MRIGTLKLALIATFWLLLIDGYMPNQIRILMVGDAVGRPGREAVDRIVPAFKRDQRADFCIINAENSAHGKGITRDTATQLLNAGADALTAGNHTWDNKDVFRFINDEKRLLRPANFGEQSDVPGRGWGLFPVDGIAGLKVAVINIIGRVMMGCSSHCPFRAVDKIIEEARAHTPIIIVDFHAEATSEKITMGRFLEGRASCVYGTHTHVQTADEQILPGGTAYITDIGMTGGHRGIIGVKYEQVIHRFMTNLPVRHEVADEDVILCGALVTVDTETGAATAMERIRVRL